jgi:hypothetical protein
MRFPSANEPSGAAKELSDFGGEVSLYPLFCFANITLLNIVKFQNLLFVTAHKKTLSGVCVLESSR